MNGRQCRQAAVKTDAERSETREGREPFAANRRTGWTPYAWRRAAVSPVTATGSEPVERLLQVTKQIGSVLDAHR